VSQTLTAAGAGPRPGPAAAAASSDGGLPPLAGIALAVTALALGLGTFMQVLDTTIANVSLPTIAGNLGVSSDQSAWVITSFAVSNAIALPLTGWLSRRFTASSFSGRWLRVGSTASVDGEATDIAYFVGTERRCPIGDTEAVTMRSEKPL